MRLLEGMSNLNTSFRVRINSSERKRLYETQLSEKLKHICPSEIRRDKALSATGYKSELDAIQWLLSHLEDPTLDEPLHREFCLFLCVRSELADKVQEFWNSSRLHKEWNHAHEFPPHITLLSNLSVPDDKVISVHAAYDKLLEEHADLLNINHVPLKLVTSANFIGYIVSSDKVNANLEKLCRTFVQELLNVGVSFEDDPLERCKSSYHLSLAYGFPSVSMASLGGLQDTYDTLPPPSITWSLDLFSSDSRLSAKDSELCEMQTTVEIDDALFAKLSSKDKLHSGSLLPEACELDVDRSSLPTSSVKSCCNEDSSCPQLLFQTHLGDVVSTTTPPQLPSTLAHKAGDYVLLIGSCNLGGQFGVPVGLNLSTGLTGVFSLASARRIPRWYAWVTHRSELVVGRTGEDYSTAEPSNVFIAPSRIPASFSVPLDFCEPLATLNVDSSTSAATVAGGSGGFCSKFLLRSCRRKSSSFTSQPSITVGSGTKTGAKTHSPPAPGSSFFVSRFFGSFLSSSSNGATQQQQPQKCQRRLYFMRHAERIDICFGRAWTTRCIDRRGLYRRVNLNMPPCLPVREDIIDHALDSPLTQVGMFVAASCGRALAEAGIRFSACYASPALRCVQTACQLLHAADHSNLAVRIEPFLFEWLGWYSGKLPNFLSPSILSEMGYNVDTGYRSVSSTEQLDLQESVSQFYARSTQLVKDILDQHQTTDANILVVGHAATLDSCTRGLLKKRFRSGGGGGGNGISSNGAGGGMNDVEELHRRCASVPYCGLLCAVEGGRRWRLEEPPIPPFTHGQNIDFDWRQFQSYSFCSFDIK